MPPIDRSTPLLSGVHEICIHIIKFIGRPKEARDCRELPSHTGIVVDRPAPAE